MTPWSLNLNLAETWESVDKISLYLPLLKYNAQWHLFSYCLYWCLLINSWDDHTLTLCVGFTHKQWEALIVVSTWLKLLGESILSCVRIICSVLQSFLLVLFWWHITLSLPMTASSHWPLKHLLLCWSSLEHIVFLSLSEWGLTNRKLELLERFTVFTTLHPRAT